MLGRAAAKPFVQGRMINAKSPFDLVVSRPLLPCNRVFAVPLDHLNSPSRANPGCEGPAPAPPAQIANDGPRRVVAGRARHAAARMRARSAMVKARHGSPVIGIA